MSIERRLPADSPSPQHTVFDAREHFASQPDLLPVKQRKRRAGKGIPEILLTLLCVGAALSLFALGPARAPSLSALIEFTCDTPTGPAALTARRNSRGYYYSCHYGNQTAHVMALPPVTNSLTWRDCRRAYGIVRIWRASLQSPYGGNIFQMTCNGVIVTDYPGAAAAYESRRSFVAIIAWLLLISSTGALAFRFSRSIKERERRALTE
jgi:hypothetical protein